MIVLLIFFVLSNSISADGNKKKKKKDPPAYVLIHAYLTIETLLPDSCQLPDFSTIEYPHEIRPSAPGKSCLLSKLPMVDEPDVIQVWRLMLPERTGPLRLESEEQLSGEIESQETLIQREMGPIVEVGRPLLPFATVPDLPVLVPISPGPDFDLEAERRTQEAHTDDISALSLQSYFEELERAIHDVHTGPINTPVLDRMNSFMDELRQISATRDRLASITSLRPAVPTAQGQLQNSQINQLQSPNLDTVGMMDLVDILHHSITESLQNDLQGNLRDSQNSPDVLDNPFQGRARTRANLAPTASLTPTHPITQMLLPNVRNVNVLMPTIVTPQTHGDANHAVIEGPETDEDPNPDPISVEEVHGEGVDVVMEGLTIDETFRPKPSEQEIRPENQHPMAAALLRAVPDHDATPDEVDPVAQRSFESEEGQSDPAPDVHVQDIQTDNGATPINTLHSLSSSPAVLTPPTATATGIATLSFQELEDILNEELYTDVYP